METVQIFSHFNIYDNANDFIILYLKSSGQRNLNVTHPFKPLKFSGDGHRKGMDSHPISRFNFTLCSTYYHTRNRKKNLSLLSSWPFLKLFFCFPCRRKTTWIHTIDSNQNIHGNNSMWILKTQWIRVNETFLFFSGRLEIGTHSHPLLLVLILHPPN